jgi:hypothetical protein
MTKKERFLLFVYLAAMAEDAMRRTSDAARIVAYASNITEEKIPTNIYNAALAYVHYFYGGLHAMPFKWMLAKR